MRWNRLELWTWVLVATLLGLILIGRGLGVL